MRRPSVPRASTAVAVVAAVVAVLTLIVFLGLGIVAALASVAQASDETTPSRRLFESLDARVQWLAPDGCTITNAFFGFKQVTMLAPNPEDAPYFQLANVSLGRFDTCSPGGSFSSIVEGELSVDEFTISSSDLSSARAVADGTLVNGVDGSTVYVQVDVSFALSDGVIRRAGSSPCIGEDLPRCEIIGTHADGTVSGVIDVAGSNFLPDASSTVLLNEADLDSLVLVNWPCFPCP